MDLFQAKYIYMANVFNGKQNDDLFKDTNFNDTMKQKNKWNLHIVACQSVSL